MCFPQREEHLLFSLNYAFPLLVGAASVPTRGVTLSACCSSICPLPLHLVAFAEGLDLLHDARHGLFHTLFQQPALTLTLWILWICQGLQRGCQVLQTHHICSLLIKKRWFGQYPVLVSEAFTYLLSKEK